jgi:hypothetical protein
MEHPSDLDKLKYYRDEVKHEFNLLAMRSNMLVTCQSFLVVPWGILNNAADFRTVLVPCSMIAVLGIFVALVLLEPINAAHRTIGKWLVKQRALFRDTRTIGDMAIDRDTIPGADVDADRDRDHVKSLAFTRHSPMAFVVFWAAAIVWSAIRTVVGF